MNKPEGFGWYRRVTFRNVNPRTGGHYQQFYGPYANKGFGPAPFHARQVESKYGLIKNVSDIFIGARA